MKHAVCDNPVKRSNDHHSEIELVQMHERSTGLEHAAAATSSWFIENQSLVLIIVGSAILVIVILIILIICLRSKTH